MVFRISFPLFQNGDYSSRQKIVGSKCRKIANSSKRQKLTSKTTGSKILDSLITVQFFDLIGSFAKFV